MIIIRRAQITQNKRKYIGLLVVSTDPTIERDFRRMLHNIDQVDFFVSRVPYAGVYTPENYQAMEGEINRATALILPGDHCLWVYVRVHRNRGTDYLPSRSGSSTGYCLHNTNNSGS
uniref:Uncharacterized protein n=1 Tax=Candidatus Kentrum sp. MB TaxID=2138164 RepID=A0A450XNN2_9GAMM|nr:MAG: hypothetical protein BECKMB1821G_GA0114241_10747 [Candidatus Kentron sp. MB]